MPSRFIFRIALGLLLLLPPSPTLAGSEGVWETEDMVETPDLLEKLPSSLKSLDARLDGTGLTSGSDCGDHECFQLHYFTNRAFNLADKKRKNILFISGGPGQITMPRSPLTAFLEDTHNVVYFLLRGVGLSTIPLESRYDKFLRAHHVVGDIERLRTTVLRSGIKWDAVFGFSYGTVVAQLYANQKPQSLNRLILLSPIVRYRPTAVARTARMIRTLDEIYRFVRSTSCDCKNTDIQVPIKPLDTSTTLGSTIDPGDNFCFVDISSTPSGSLVDKITSRVKDVYKRLEDHHYGAIGFLTENWNKLHNDDEYRDLKDEFQQQFPYPQEFFIALKELQTLDSPGHPNFVLAGDIISMVDSAAILGYYASLEEDTLRQLAAQDFPCCVTDAPFFGAVTCTPNDTYVQRIEMAKTRLLGKADGGESRRALYVFGVSDGLQPWLPRILKESGITPADENCPRGDDLKRFVDGDGNKYKFLRKETAKIGIVPQDPYCLWNPDKFKHEVQTLAIKGAADAVTAGCQAEEFVGRGLAPGKRVLIEFPGKGHQPFPPMRTVLHDLTVWAKDYLIWFDTFMTKSVQEFRQDTDVKKALEFIGGIDVTDMVNARFQNYLKTGDCLE
jgi:pimeloyl-ACP methyl ester carboxylesterase